MPPVELLIPLLGLGVLSGASEALVGPNTHSLGSHLLLISNSGRSLQGEGKVEKKWGKKNPKTTSKTPQSILLDDLQIHPAFP